MTAEKKLPLEGILVLELGHTVMGPTTGLILADMGPTFTRSNAPARG
jgi:crotonobetainyl-CoA:carnitine CoA-transferase CaiB-like acyl-CoA transferase